MIKISGLRLEPHGEWTRLVCDLEWSGGMNPFGETSMWYAVKNKNASMFNAQTYDAFLLVPYYLGMYYNQDVMIEGRVSERLCRNLRTYVKKMLQDFSDDLSPVRLNVQGFGNADGNPTIVGAGISCGVDSLSTIHEYYAMEEDSEYRINSLFIFNCGTHGDFENPETFRRFQARYEMNKKAAGEMGLPIVQVDSNIHAFTHKIAEQKVGYFAIWSCILSLERAIRKYYVSSAYSYREIMRFGSHSHDFDMAEFSESYLLPLLRTESMELILDGCQYKRTEKTVNISDWDIARRHLNVCVSPVDGARNCSCCSKCMRTLVPLEAMGKLEAFSGVFDLEVYRKNAWKNKLKIAADYGREGFATDNVDFARQCGLKMPGILEVSAYRFLRAAKHGLKRMIKGRQ